jgi:hypothetical protein
LNRLRFTYVAWIAVTTSPVLDWVVALTRTVILNGTVSPRARKVPPHLSGA